MQDSQTEITRIVDSDGILNPEDTWRRVRKHSQKPRHIFFFFSCVAIFLTARPGKLVRSPGPHSQREQRYLSSRLGKRRGPLWNKSRRLPCQRLPLPALVLAEGTPENSLSALFGSEKVRLSAALAGLRDVGHRSLARGLHREEQRGMGNVRPFPD